jgi:hypothetical protein
MWIMAIMLVKKVGSIKLPNGCHTQAVTETLRELYRVHFPGAAAGETRAKAGTAKPGDIYYPHGGLGTV